jgi:hypothetical protein
VRHDGDDTFWLAFTEDDALHVRGVLEAGTDVGMVGDESYDVAADGIEARGSAGWQRFGDRVLLATIETVTDEDAEHGFRHLLRAREFTPDAGLGEPIALADDLTQWHRWVGSVAVGNELRSFFVGRSETREQLARSRYSPSDGLVEAATPFMPEGWFGSITPVTAEQDRALLVYNRLDWEVGFGGDRVRLRFVGDRSWLLGEGAACTDGGECASGRCIGGQCCADCSLWDGAPVQVE